MSAAHAHRIETLTWELRHRTPQEALQGHAFQQRLWGFLKDEGLACIARQLDRMDERLGSTQHVISLDRLELDLGALHPAQSEDIWRTRLSEVLEASLLRALTPDLDPHHGHAKIGIGIGMKLHEVDQFMSYLDLGHLPWNLSALPHGSLAHWFAALVRHHGQRMWLALEAHPQRARLMLRLQQIHPHAAHDGLHALLAQRHPFLAQALAHLDDIALAPLQLRGHLSVHERDKLRQALRTQALDMLWHGRGQQLGATRRRQLLQALQAVLAQALGADWQERLRPLIRPVSADQGAVAALVHDLIEPTTSAASSAPADEAWEADLARWRPLVQRGRHLALDERHALLQHLQRLRQAHPEVLRERLRQWMAEPDQRRRWALSLDAATLGGVLGMVITGAAARAGTGSTGGAADPVALRPGAAAVHWAESLRQTALRLHRMAQAQARPGVSRLQGLLMEACLQAVAHGERLPDTHAGWQQFWETAWLRWQDPDHLPTQTRPIRTASATPPSQHDARNPSSPQDKAGGAGGSWLDRTLRSLAKQCEQGRWQWPQRLRMARVLSSETACKRWVQLFSESKRWQMIKAQFGAMAPALEQRASRLQQWLGQRLREPAAAAAEHWQRLCRFLFVQGKTPDTATLRRDYQRIDPRNDPSALASANDKAQTIPKTQTAAPIWVDDAGQVLIAVYAERLFKVMGLIEGGRFRSPEAQAEGVQCLQALCHGDQDRIREECHTVLSRLLCGVEPAGVLPRPAPLKAETLSMLEQLLQAVIGHWKALGNTSVAGLRESFLCRQGRLIKEPVRHDAPPAWRLVVEKRGFDVLLDRLPWSYNTIRLPWMEGVLHVEWR